MLKVGNYEISCLVTDRFRLDGGAMFGSVPKVLWSKLIGADERNRIALVCRVLVVRDATQPSRLILIDVGMGRKWKEREQNIYAIEHLYNLAASPLASSVTDLILTHLHFDHGGGISSYNSEGNLTLNFPEATVFLQKKNWLHAQSPGIREQASYLPENITPLLSAALQLTHNGEDLLPEIRVFCSDGHTHGLQWVLIGSGKGAVAYPADLIPTRHHIPIPYVMGYDLCAERSMNEKEMFLARAVQDEWIVVFEHDSEVSAGVIGRDQKGRFVFSRECEIPLFA